MASSDAFAGLLPGETPSYDDLVQAVRDLHDAQKNISVGDLPVKQLQDKLEQTWQPSAAALLGPASITAEMLQSSPLGYVKSQGTAAAQSASGNGVALTYNATGAPVLDLDPGTWFVECEAILSSNVQDYAVIGLWNDTDSTGVSGSAGAASLVSTTAWATARCVNVVKLTAATSYRIWVLPNGSSTLTVLAHSNVPNACMLAYRLGSVV